jgi:hypothetical protein
MSNKSCSHNSNRNKQKQRKAKELKDNPKVKQRKRIQFSSNSNKNISLMRILTLIYTNKFCWHSSNNYCNSINNKWQGLPLEKEKCLSQNKRRNQQVDSPLNIVYRSK